MIEIYQIHYPFGKKPDGPNFYTKTKMKLTGRWMIEIVNGESTLYLEHENRPAKIKYLGVLGPIKTKPICTWIPEDCIIEVEREVFINECKSEK